MKVIHPSAKDYVSMAKKFTENQKPLPLWPEDLDVMDYGEFNLAFIPTFPPFKGTLTSGRFQIKDTIIINQNDDQSVWNYQLLKRAKADDYILKREIPSPDDRYVVDYVIIEIYSKVKGQDNA